MSSSNCCFLICTQISRKAGQVVWYPHLFKNFPQFVVIHTVKSFSIVSEAEVDVFLEFSCFFYDPVDVGNFSLIPLPFLNPPWVSGSSWFMYYWSFAWRILSITLLACENVKWVQSCGSLNILWHCPSLGLEWELTFSNPMATAEFSKFAGTLTAPSFRSWNNSAGIPSPPLALFVVMLAKARLTSYSRCLALG